MLCSTQCALDADSCLRSDIMLYPRRFRYVTPAPVPHYDGPTRRPTPDPTYWRPLPTYRPTAAPTDPPTLRQLSQPECRSRASAVVTLGGAVLNCVRNTIIGDMQACAMCMPGNAFGAARDINTGISGPPRDLGDVLGVAASTISAGECALTCAKAAGRLATLTLAPWLRVAIAGIGCAVSLAEAAYEVNDALGAGACDRRTRRQLPAVNNNTVGLLAGLGVGGQPPAGEDPPPPVVDYIRAGLTMRLGMELWATPYFGGAVFTANGHLSPAAEAWALVNDTAWVASFRAAGSRAVLQ